MIHEHNVEVLLKSIEMRKNADLSKLIHHSDKGGQYCSTAYIEILNGHKPKSS